MLFYYKQIQITAPTEEDIKAGKQRHLDNVVDFFDPQQILRGRIYADGSAIVLLKDGHEQQDIIPLKNGGEKIGHKKWVQSEIMLSPEDMARLRNFTELLEEGEEPYLGPVPQTEKEPSEEPQPQMEQVGPNDKY